MKKEKKMNKLNSSQFPQNRSGTKQDDGSEWKHNFIYLDFAYIIACEEWYYSLTFINIKITFFL